MEVRPGENFLVIQVGRYQSRGKEAQNTGGWGWKAGLA